MPERLAAVTTRVLIVEDDDGIGTSLERGLRLAGYDATRVVSGAAALTAPAADVVLLDLGLPDIDGMDVCRQLRERSGSAVIVVTARGEETDRVAALDIGADDYLVKPFGFSELTARIRAVLRRSQPHQRTVVVHGPLTIDSRGKRVSVGDRELDLTPKEYDILECLASDPGRVFTRQEILERVWDWHWYGPTKVLDVHVAALRRKLGVPDLIVTVYGRGFRLGDPGVTRRITAGLIGLVVAIVTLVALPLGLRTVSRENTVFRAQAIQRAQSLADIVEEQLSGPSRHVDLSQFLTNGDQVTVVSSSGDLVTGSGSDPPVDQALTRMAAHGQETTVRRGDQLFAAVRVGDAPERDGALLLRRPTASLDASVRDLWIRLAVTATLALVAATAMSWQIARWVGRPLRRLEDTAAAFGDGHLDARAATIAGPPEVRALARSFDRMAARLEALVHGHRGMLADVSHQLRTPLAALRLRLELMRASESNTTELDGALGEVTRLSRLVDGLLAVSRAEGATTAVEAVDVERLIAERVAAWRPVAAERAVVLDHVVTGSPTASATAGHLEQVLDNLIDNALEALPGGGHIRLLADADDGEVRLRVVDDGPGIPVDRRERALRRFSSDRTGRGGAGLGLAIVHRLVTVDGGAVELDETPGGGLTVRISLPMTRPHRSILYRF